MLKTSANLIIFVMFSFISYYLVEFKSNSSQNIRLILLQIWRCVSLTTAMLPLFLFFEKTYN